MKRAVLRRFLPVSGRRLWMADGALNWIQERSQKNPAVAGFLNRSLADFRGIAECNCKKQSGNREGKDEDVSEAFHRGSPERRSVEGCSSGRNVALGQTAGRFVAEFGEQTEFHLVAEIGVDTGKHIAVEGASTVPDVTEEEEQRKGGVAEGEPAAG